MGVSVSVFVGVSLRVSVRVVVGVSVGLSVGVSVEVTVAVSVGVSCARAGDEKIPTEMKRNPKIKKTPRRLGSTQPLPVLKYAYWCFKAVFLIP